MSARDWLEYDGKPGTSATDVVTAVVVAMMLLAMVGLVAMIVWATGDVVSAIREYLEAKAALPEKEWLRREPRETHPAILEAVRAFRDEGGFYDDDAERYVNELAGDLPPHKHHGTDRGRVLDQLGHEVYIAKGVLRDQDYVVKTRQLRDSGYVPLETFEVQDGGRYMLACGTLYVGAEIPAYGEPKPVRAHAGDGRVVFLPKGARTRGLIPNGPAMIREGWTS